MSGHFFQSRSDCSRDDWKPGDSWVAVQELDFLGKTRFPLKGSFNGDMDIDHTGLL